MYNWWLIVGNQCTRPKCWVEASPQENVKTYTFSGGGLVEAVEQSRAASLQATGSSVDNGLTQRPSQSQSDKDVQSLANQPVEYMYLWNLTCSYSMFLVDLVLEWERTDLCPGLNSGSRFEYQCTTPWATNPRQKSVSPFPLILTFVRDSWLSGLCTSW